MLSRILQEIKQLIAAAVIHYPETPFGQYLRKKYWLRSLNFKRNHFIIERSSKIGLPGLVQIGEHFILGEYSVIAAGDSDPIYIGNHVAIARNSFIRTANHRIDDLSKPIMFQGHDYSSMEYKESRYSIVIEDDVWIGTNVVVLSGAFIGTGSVIAAGSVVSGHVEPYSVMMGNPAKKIRSRK